MNIKLASARLWKIEWIVTLTGHECSSGPTPDGHGLPGLSHLGAGLDEFSEEMLPLGACLKLEKLTLELEVQRIKFKGQVIKVFRHFTALVNGIFKRLSNALTIRECILYKPHSLLVPDSCALWSGMSPALPAK